MRTIKNLAGKQLVFLAAFVMFCAGCRPPGPRALFQGKDLMDRGRYPEALEKLKTAAGLLGTNAQAFNYLGLAYHHTGQAAEAANAYRRALALNPDLSEAHYNLGCLWLEQNKLDAAKAELTGYTLRRSNDPEGFLKLGAAQLRSAGSLGAQRRAAEVAAAEKSFGEALKLSPQNAEALTGLGLAQVQRGRPGEATPYFKSALKQQPNYAPALLNLAILEQNYLSDRQAALDAYRRYLALRPPRENAEAVKAIALQLEQELIPPTSPATVKAVSQSHNNVSPTKAAPAEVARGAKMAKPPATNLSRVLGAPKAEPPVTPAKPPPAFAAAKPPPPATAPKAPVSTDGLKSSPAVAAPAPAATETVTLGPEPVIKPAQDVMATAPREPAPAISSPATETSTAPADAASAKTAKRSLLQKINPLNLFSGGAKTAPTPISLPPPANAAPPEVGKAAAPQTAGAPGSAPGRYPYKSPARPGSGNRPEAQRAFDRGAQAYQARKLPEAIQAYLRAIQLDPAYFDAYYNLALATAESGNPAQGLVAYELALAIRPESLDARYNFALLLKQANYPVDAANELEKLLATSPNEVRAHLALGNLYAEQLHQPDHARPHYLKVLEIEPHNPQAEAIRYWLSAPHP